MKHWSDMGELGIDLSQKFPCLSRKYSCSKINFQKKFQSCSKKTSYSEKYSSFLGKNLLSGRFIV